MPELFRGLMAAAIGRRDVAQWASEQGIATERPKSTESVRVTGHSDAFG